MKICVVTTVFPRWYNDGEGAFLWQFAKILRQQGLTVRVIAMHSPGTATHEFFEDIEVFRPPYWWPQAQEMLRKDGGGLPINVRKYPLARVQLFPFAIRHLLHILRYAQDCDLIHAHFTLAAALACLGKRWHQRPVVATVHGSDIFQVPRYPGGTWFTRQTLTACARVTTVSEALFTACTKLGVPPAQMQVIPNSIDTTIFCPATATQQTRLREESIVLFVGSLIKRKGVTYLLDAMQTVLQHCPDSRLVIIGEGPEQAGLQNQANQLGIAEKVVFMGALSQGQVRDWMQKARLLVVPSLEEGQGVVALEALACATPVIASAVGGLPDIVPATVGLLAPPADTTALAKAIIQLLRNEPQWLAFSEAARTYIMSHFDGPVIGKQYGELYQTLLEGKKIDE